MINKKYGVSSRQVERYGWKLTLEIYEKYNRKCSVCGSENKLSIHHIDRSGLSNNPNNEISNLQLICASCHQRLHANIRWEKQLKKQGGYKMKGREKEYKKEYDKKYHKKRLKNLTEEEHAIKNERNRIFMIGYRERNIDKIREANRKYKHRKKQKTN